MATLISDIPKRQTMRLSCEPLAPPDIPQACELFAKVFGHTIQPEHWHWKYIQGPRLASFNLIVRTPQGQIVGHVGASVFPGHTQGQILPMAQVSDVMVHPNARSAYGQDQSLYSLLMKTLQQEMHVRFPQLYAYGFVGIRPYKLGHRMGLYRSRQECRSGQLTVPVQSAGLRNGYCHAYSIDWTQALDSGLFEKTSAQARRQLARPMLERSSSYMRWRYQQHPTHVYQLWIVRKWWRDTGWAVTRRMPNGEHMLIDQWPVPLGSTADRRTQCYLDAVLLQLAAEATQPPVLASWSIDTPQSRQSEPVIGTEFRVREFQAQILSPLFMPGDTDVY